MGHSMGIGRNSQVSRSGQVPGVRRNLRNSNGRQRFRLRSTSVHSLGLRPGLSSGFTLIELMVVITLILILASFAMPSYHIAVIHAREAVLRDDLFTMRKTDRRIHHRQAASALFPG